MVSQALMSVHRRDGTLLHMTAQPRNPVTELRLGVDELRGYLQSRLAGMSSSEADVLRLVIEDPQFAAEATTAQLAQRAGVSPPTVVRAARAAGFGGFAELKLGLAYARGSARFFTPPQMLDAVSTPAGHIHGHGWGSACVEFGGGHTRPRRRRRGRRADRRFEPSPGRRCWHLGRGRSRYRLPSHHDRHRRAEYPDHMSALVTARLLRGGDVALAFSATGRTSHTLSVCDAARSSGASSWR